MGVHGSHAAITTDGKLDLDRFSVPRLEEKRRNGPAGASNGAHILEGSEDYLLARLQLLPLDPTSCWLGYTLTRFGRRPTTNWHKGIKEEVIRRRFLRTTRIGTLDVSHEKIAWEITSSHFYTIRAGHIR